MVVEDNPNKAPIEPKLRKRIDNPLASGKSIKKQKRVRPQKPEALNDSSQIEAESEADVEAKATVPERICFCAICGTASTVP